MNYQLKSVSFKLFAVLLAVSVLAGNPSIAQKRTLNKSQKGAIVGASGGAVVGAIFGQSKGNTALGAILGATVGGAAGALIGHRMDKRAEEIRRQMPAAQVERVGEGIKVTMGSDILFDTDSYALKPATRQQLVEFARTLNKEEDTDIRVEGHADATGSAQHNLTLSRERADAVAAFLESQGVRSARVAEKGYGESQPIADNATAAGRQRNRRVDIAIFANKKMQRDAQNGRLSTE